MPGNILNYRSVASKDGFGIQNLPLLWPRSNIPQADCLREQEKKKKKSVFCLQQQSWKKKSQENLLYGDKFHTSLRNDLDISN